MTFVDAIKTCLSKYADFNGCATRSEYWWWVLFLLLAAFISAVIHPKLMLVFYLATLLPTFAVTARRLHDTDRSGWWQLISIVPLIGLILLVFLLQGSRIPNRFEEASV